MKLEDSRCIFSLDGPPSGAVRLLSPDNNGVVWSLLIQNTQQQQQTYIIISKVHLGKVGVAGHMHNFHRYVKGIRVTPQGQRILMSVLKWHAYLCGNISSAL